MPPVYLRTQQLSWLEISATPPPSLCGKAMTRMQNGAGPPPGTHPQVGAGRAAGRHPVRAVPRRSRATRTATAPKVGRQLAGGPGLARDRRHLKHRHLKHAHFKHAHLKKTRKPDPDQASC